MIVQKAIADLSLDKANLPLDKPAKAIRRGVLEVRNATSSFWYASLYSPLFPKSSGEPSVFDEKTSLGLSDPHINQKQLPIAGHK